MNILDEVEPKGVSLSRQQHGTVLLLLTTVLEVPFAEVLLHVPMIDNLDFEIIVLRNRESQAGAQKEESGCKNLSELHDC